MKRLYFCLVLTLVLLWLSSGVGLPAGRTVAVDAAVSTAPSGSRGMGAPARIAEAGGVPDGLTAAGWRAIQSQVAKLTPNDGGAGFGSVSLDGDTAVVGAGFASVGGNTDQGAAYVFYRNQGGPDSWGQVAKLTAGDGAAVDRFGSVVSVSGDTAVIGAFCADVSGNQEQGAAYVFYRNQGGPDAWGQVAKLTSADGAAWDFFGASVSVSGDTAVVGAYWADVGGSTDQGAAYVFYRNQGGADVWGQVAKLTAAGATGELRFGSSVSVSGDTALVGAYYVSTAYVYYRNQGGANAWGQVARLTPADGAGSFGTSVSVNGDRAVVGADWANVGGSPQGAAYVFDRDQGGADTWGQVVRLSAADGVSADYFGSAVAVSGDTIIVGASHAAIGGNYYQGAAYVFHRNWGWPGSWGQEAKLTASDGQWGDSFGGSIAYSGDTILAGAYAAAPAGAAYVYSLPPVPAAWCYLPLALHYCADFFDDFSSPDSGWPVGEDDYVRTEYLNGEFRILTKQAGYLYLFGAPACHSQNYIVEADARWTYRIGNSYGLLFGITAGFENYYLFDINTDYRMFRLYRRDPTGFTSVVPATESTAINAGEGSNHLKVTRDGALITLEVNGSVLGSWSDGTITGLTGVGIVSSPYSSRPKSEALFDNFRVTRISGNSAAPPQVPGTPVAEEHGPLAPSLQRDSVPAQLVW